MATPMQFTKPAFTIVVSEKGGAERREHFATAELSIGRIQGNDLILAKGNVSKQHAKLLHRDGRFIVTDLNSTNGTYVNRRKIQQATVVNEGDRIYVGDFVLRIEVGTNEAPSGSGVGVEVPLDPMSTTGTTGRTRSSPEVARDSRSDSAELPEPARVPPPPRPALQSWNDATTGQVGRISDMTGRFDGRMVRDSLANAGPETLAPRDPEGGEAFEELVQGVLDGMSSNRPTGPPYGSEPQDIDRALDEQLQRLVHNGRLPAGIQQDRLRAYARSELLEYGPLGRLLEDDSVLEIVVARHDTVMARRSGSLDATGLRFASDVSLRRIIARLAGIDDRVHLGPEGTLARRLSDGTILWALLPPVGTASAVLVLRRRRAVAISLQALARGGVVSRPMAAFLQQAVAARLRLLVAGGRDADVASVTGALCGAVTEGPLLLIEGQDEVGSASAVVPVIPWTWLGVSDAAALVRSASWIGAPCVAVSLESPETTSPVIEILGASGQGLIAATEARTIEMALTRLALDAMMNRAGLSMEAARRRVAASFDLVLEVVRCRDGRQRVMRIGEFGSVSADEIGIDDIFTFNLAAGSPSDPVEGTFRVSGTTPRVVAELSSRGGSFDSTLFSATPSH